MVHNSGLWDYFYTTMATEYYSGTLQTRQIDSIYSLIQAALWYVHKLKSIIGLNTLLECMLVSTKYYPTQNNLHIDKPPFCWDMKQYQRLDKRYGRSITQFSSQNTWTSDDIWICDFICRPNLISAETKTNKC